MANADTTERLREQTLALEQQLRGQRELLQITESILTKLDARGVLESLTERLERLIVADNVAIEIVDPANGLLTPLTARGVDAAAYLEPWAPGETGVATWVVEHNEPVLIGDERHDARVNHFREGGGPVDGSLIVVPLRGRGGAIGVLTIERLGLANTFSAEEFELVQLFAAQVSIALQNAEVFQAVEIRARTDDLTGLFNHGTFQEWLERNVRDGTPFSLIMLDLDDFRKVNNDRGHQAGDDLLRRIAAGLVGAGRDTDLVFRYGGDEFTFLLPHTDEGGALNVAERARQAVVSTDLSVTASIGVATYPVDGADRERCPAGGRPGLLRGQAQRAEPDRHRGRRPRPCSRDLAPAADPGRLRPSTGGVTDRHPGFHRGVTVDDMRTRGPAFPSLAGLAFLLLAVVALVGCVPDPADRTGGSDIVAAATPTPEPTPAGPTPTPSFVRPTPTPQPTFFVYIVKRGDTLGRIAKLYGTDGRSIAYWNRITYPSLDPDSAQYRPDYLVGRLAARSHPEQPGRSGGPATRSGDAVARRQHGTRRERRPHRLTGPARRRYRGRACPNSRRPLPGSW